MDENDFEVQPTPDDAVMQVWDSSFAKLPSFFRFAPAMFRGFLLMDISLLQYYMVLAHCRCADGRVVQNYPRSADSGML